MYLVLRSVEDLAEGSAKNYFTILNLFFRDVKMKVSDIDATTIRAWLYNVKKNRKVSDRTLACYKIVIGAFFEWCVTNDLIERNPCRSIPSIKYVETKRCYLTQEELEEIRNNTECLRDRVMIEIWYSIGMRCTEITTIKMSDLDLQNKTIMVYNQKGKRYKTCFLNDKAVYWLKKYIPTRCKDNDFIIQGLVASYGPITKAGAESIVRRLMAKCNIDKHVIPSTFRHTTATQALNNGMDVTEIQKMLGHANIEMTMIYAEVNQNDVKTSHKKYII